MRGWLDCRRGWRRRRFGCALSRDGNWERKERGSPGGIVGTGTVDTGMARFEVDSLSQMEGEERIEVVVDKARRRRIEVAGDTGWPEIVGMETAPRMVGKGNSGEGRGTRMGSASGPRRIEAVQGVGSNLT